MRRRPLVIAHRGASGYLPEHTLVAKAMAIGMGADYVEQDIIATRDGELLVFHDLTLDDMTDVAVRYPQRARADGHFYCVDFTLQEIRNLGVAERRAPGSSEPRFAGRFPDGAGQFRIPTLEEEIRFVQGLIQSTGRRIGIYPEIKEPEWHRQQGMDLSTSLVGTLNSFGYTTGEHDVFVQCFEPLELERLRDELNCQLPLVALIDSAGGVPSAHRLREISRYATAIGPSMRLIYQGMNGVTPIVTTLVRDAHDAGLDVHPYTLRRDDLPPAMAGIEEALELLFLQLGVDGIFTDFPDLAVRFVDRHFPA